VSGYTGGASAERLDELHAEILSKPFTHRERLWRVRHGLPREKSSLRRSRTAAENASHPEVEA
jgi:hypothetical protein